MSSCASGCAKRVRWRAKCPANRRGSGSSRRLAPPHRRCRSAARSMERPLFAHCGHASRAIECRGSTSGGMGGGLGGLRRKAFLIGLGLGGLLKLLFHWLEGGSEHGGGQLGNVPARAAEGSVHGRGVISGGIGGGKARRS